MAVLAVLPTAMVSVTFASATAQADDCKLSKENGPNLVVTASEEGVTYENVTIVPGSDEESIVGYTYRGTFRETLDGVKDVIWDSLSTGEKIKYSLYGALVARKDAAYNDKKSEVEVNKAFTKDKLDRDYSLTVNGKLTSTGILFTPEQLPDNRKMSVTTTNGGDMVLNDVNGSNIHLNSAKDLTIGGTANMTNGSIIAAEDVTLNSLTATNVDVTANGGDVIISGAASLTDGDIKASQDVFLNSLTATNVKVEAASGEGSAAGDVIMTGAVDMTKGSISGKNVTIGSPVETDGKVVLQPVESVRLTASSVEATGGNVNINASNVSLAADFGIDFSQVMSGKVLIPVSSIKGQSVTIDTNGSNTIFGGSIEAKNGKVTMGGEKAVNAVFGLNVDTVITLPYGLGDLPFNVGMPTTVTATGDVTMSGGLNTLLGTASVTSTGGNVCLTGSGIMSAGSLKPMIDELNLFISKFEGLNFEYAGYELNVGDAIIKEVSPLLTELSTNADKYLAPLEQAQVNANLMLGGSVTAETGSVTLDSVVNLMVGTTVKAESGTATLAGSLNAVMLGSVNAGNIVLQASETNQKGIVSVIESFLTKEQNEQLAPVLGAFTDLDSVSANLLMGGELTASNTVTMDNTINLLMGSKVSGNTVAMSGAINAVVSGSLTGNTVTLSGSDSANLGGLLSGMLGDYGYLVEDLEGNLNVMMGGTITANSAKTEDGVYEDGSGSVTLNGTANVLMNGDIIANTVKTEDGKVNGGNVTLNGIANAMTGGKIEGNSVVMNGAINFLMGGSVTGNTVTMQQGTSGIDVGGVIKPLLESAGVGAEITDLVGNLGKINGNINVVTGNAVVNGTDSVKMDALANVVMGEGAQVTGGKVTLTGTQYIDLPLGSIINGLASQYVELPEAVTGVLGSLDGKIGLNTNVIINGGSVSATDKAVIDASVNYIGNGGSVSGANLVQLYGPMNLVLSNGSLISENGTVRMNGYGPSLNELGVQIPAEYADYANKLGLSGLLNKQFGVNVVMGEGAKVSGKGIELNSGLMNLVADGAELEATAVNGMSLSSAANVVLNGAKLSAADGTLSMSGSLNLVSSLGFNDFVNAVQNGTALPVDGALTTLSGKDVQLWGAANVVHGNVHVTATGDVVMAGMGEPLFELSTLTVQQVVDLARELGVPALLDDAKSEVLNAIMAYAAENNMSDLLEAAAALGLKDQLSGIYSDLKDFVKEHGDAALNLSFNGNVNTVSGGAMVNGNGVYMNGTINYVGDLASVTGNTVKIDGMTNVVAGGAAVNGGDVTLSGGANVLVDTTLDNVKDAIANGNLDSIVAGGKDLTTVSGNNVTLDAKVNLVNGKVAVTADNTVTMQGITNVVSGGATVSGKGSVNMDAVANVIAGGANVNAGVVDANGNVVQVGDINMTGGLNAVVDTTLGNVVDALQQQSLAPLMQGGSEVTKLSATGDINLGAALNVVNGGKVVLEAGEAVNMTGAVNVFSGNTKVNATDINMTGMEVPELDLSGILPAEYNDLANEIVEEGLNLNVVAGGAKLTAKNDITLSGVASAVVDTSMTNVLDALKQQSIDPLLKGGNIETVLTAGNDINLISKLNVVNGGKVTLTAGNDVTMAGVLNVVNGNNVVTAGNAINMDAAANLVSGGANLTANNVSIGGNAALSDEFAALIESVIPGVELPSGVSAGVVMGNGTAVNASNRVEMLSNVNVVADSAKINAETATARMAGTLNAVATAAAVSADKVEMLGTVGNLVLDGATVSAKGNATMTGAANVVQGATVTTTETGNINMEALGAVSNGLSEVVDKLLPDSETAERVNNLLAQGNANAVVDGAQLNAAGNVSMKAAANVVDNATVSAGGNVAMSSSVLHTINNSTIQSVSGNVSISGGIATVTGSTVTAEQGRINFSDVNIAMSGGSMYAADGMTVSNNAHAALSNVMLGGESFIESGSSLNISNLESIGDIENFGSLSLENAALSGGTLYNAGSISVSGELTLQSTTLVFVVDSLTQNSTAIALSGESTVLSMVSSYSRSGADGIAGVNFVITSDMLNSINNGQEFKLDIFTDATDTEYSMLKQAIQNHEISFTLNNGYNVEVTDVDMVFSGGTVSLTGTATVPEPTTATLSLLALAALAARRRRK